MMKIPEGYLLREGDVVVVLATVKYNQDQSADSISLFFKNRYSALHLDIDDIQGIHAMKWDVGDKVVKAALPQAELSFSPVYEVLAICGAEVWVKLPSGSTQTFKANDLRPWVEPITPLAPESDADFRMRILSNGTTDKLDREAAETATGMSLDIIGDYYGLTRIAEVKV